MSDLVSGAVDANRGRSPDVVRQRAAAEPEIVVKVGRETRVFGFTEADDKPSLINKYI